MKQIFLSAILILSMNAFASLEVGVYEGTFGDVKCVMGVNEISFVGDVKHPLNERVEIQVSFSDAVFSLSHLPIINIEENIIKAEKEVLKSAIAGAEQVEGVVLEMIHTDTFSGPSKITYLSENKANGEKVLKVCSDLKKI